VGFVVEAGCHGKDLYTARLRSFHINHLSFEIS
jgi:hypothetical protein